MTYSLKYEPESVNESIILVPGSKSIANRLLILQAIFPAAITLKHVPNSDDTKVLIDALNSTKKTIDIGHAGTAMRFLTAYFACKKDSQVVLTGSDRMQQRPISVLVSALKTLGANINYLKKEGFPPLEITGTQLNGNHVTLEGSVSSQYITALMLIAPTLPGGLTITIKNKITSKPYISMTSMLLNKIGIKATFNQNNIHIPHQQKIHPISIPIESDWSAASYLYSFVALSKKNITISSFVKNSIQGDSACVSLFRILGVQTIFNTNGTIGLAYKSKELPKKIEIDLNETPDLAQTLAVTFLALNIDCKLTGLETLSIKETNRLLALKTELEKLGAVVNTTSNALVLYAPKKIKSNVTIATYNDHRMAMAFAPLAVKTSIGIENPNVVTKSYPSFWEDMQQCGIKKRPIT